MFTKSHVLVKVSLGLLVAVCTALSTPSVAADSVELLTAKLSKVSQGERALLDRVNVRDLYLERVKIKSHGIVKTKKNNNDLYFKRLKSAIDLMDRHVPKSFANIQKTMKQNRGYLIIDNICPTKGALAFAAFVPRTRDNHFVVLVSSTLLLVKDLFNDYDIAAQLVHELEGHAVQYYREGRTDEINAFTKQAAFAKAAGNDKFKDVNNRSQNLRTKIKLKLSKTGTYVKSKSDTPSFSFK